MKLVYNDIEKLNIFNTQYLPLLMRQGFSTRLFPNLTTYLDVEYDGFGSSYNSKYPHAIYRGEGEQLIYVRMLTLKEALEVGWTEEFYNKYASTKPDTIIHEIGHIIHFLTLKYNNSCEWDDIWELMVRTDPISFEKGKFGVWEGQVVAFEGFAIYFADVITGKKQNLEFLQYIWELMDLHTLVFKVGSKEYTHNGVKKTMDVALPVIDGRSFVPLRVLVTELKDIKLRDVFYDDKTKEVVVIGGNNDEMWGE